MKKNTCNGFTLVLFIILFGSCVPEKAVRQEAFFDFESFIDDQIAQLSQHGRALDKKARVSRHASDTTYVPSTSGWTSELELFRQLDNINKPTYHGVYRMDDPVRDTKSNLKIRQYTSDKAPIRSLRFYYHDDFSNLKKIEAIVNEDNFLYANGRVLTMEFENEGGKPLLYHFVMTGFQKMILRDSVHFSLEGQVDQ